jgi:hypothetical protein
MNSRMEENMRQQQPQQPNQYTSNTTAPATKKNDDYIDFEEIK